MSNISKKSRMGAFLLSLFFGVFGVHRFYVGKISSGVFQLLMTISVFLSPVSFIWNFIDIIKILTGEFIDRDGQKVLKW